MKPSNRFRRWVVLLAATVAATSVAVCVSAAGSAGLPTLEQRGGISAIALGKRLFSDSRLSADSQMSCATCHDPGQGFTQNGRPTPEGRDGRPLRRNASTLLNVGFATPLMHDGAAPSLEAQVLTPLLDGNEMGNATFAELEARLAAVPEYVRAFQESFGSGPSMATIGAALAAYERSLVSANSAFDRLQYGGIKDALSAEERRGLALFAGKAGCVSCHLIGDTSALFTDNLMHNTGVAALSGSARQPVSRSGSSTIDFAAAGDRGRHEVTQNPGDLYRFRTPTLRNVALTSPYMHNGSMATLTDVVRFYNAGGGANDNLDPAIKPLGLNDGEIADLVAFLGSLTGDNVEQLAADAKAFAPVASRVSP